MLCLGCNCPVCPDATHDTVYVGDLTFRDNMVITPDSTKQVDYVGFDSTGKPIIKFK